MVEQIAEDYPDRFAPLTMHVNADGFDTAWGQNRLDAFYGVPGAAPTFMVDALWNCQSSDYRYYVEEQMAQPTDVTLELFGNPVGGSTWNITARACLEGGAARQVRIFAAAALDNHPELQSYATNVLMQDVFESDTTLSAGGCQNVTFRIGFDSVSMANSSNIVIVAWAQKPSTSAPTEVYQSAIMRWPFPTGSQLNTIEVAPADVTIAIGGETVFTATGKDQFGDPVALDNPQWELGPTGTGAGSFDPGSGSDTTTFTATVAGSRQVFCTSAGVTGAAVVTIQEPPQLASIEIDPENATVDVNGQIAFAAAGKDQYGEDFPLTDPGWSLGGDGDGVFDPATGATTTFTATYPGSLDVSCDQGDITGSAEIEIVGEDPALATITVSPETARIRVGEEVEFTASGVDQYGRAFELGDPVWHVDGDGGGDFDPATGATVTTFTGTTAGEARAVCTDGGIVGSASLEISPRGLPAPRAATGRVAP